MNTSIKLKVANRENDIILKKDSKITSANFGVMEILFMEKLEKSSHAIDKLHNNPKELGLPKPPTNDISSQIE